MSLQDTNMEVERRDGRSGPPPQQLADLFGSVSPSLRARDIYIVSLDIYELRDTGRNYVGILIERKDDKPIQKEILHVGPRSLGRLPR